MKTPEQIADEAGVLTIAAQFGESAARATREVVIFAIAADRAQRAAVNSTGVEVVKEYLESDAQDELTQGYVIERSEHGYRYVWREYGEPDDEGTWVATEQGAIKAAWNDWDTNGQGYHWHQWSKDLAHDAGYYPKAKETP